MNQAKRFDFDDEDPFADTFGEAEAQPLAEPGPDAGDGAAEIASGLAEPTGAEPAVDETQAEPAPDAEPTVEPVQHEEAAPAPFDWAAQLPAQDPEPTPAARGGRFDWFTALTKPRAAKPKLEAAASPSPSPEAEPAPEPSLADINAETAPGPQGLDDPRDYAPEPERDPEPEVLADAPSVPAAFDDALTEPEVFDLAAPAAAAPTAAAAARPTSPVAEMIASVEAALGEAAVPRIAIHIFAQNAETAAIAQTAAGDRRLAKASTAVRPGGLPEALALYATSPTPALVIVENTAPAMQLLADLERLAEVCDPGTKVVVIGEANDVGLYRELIRRGVSEYLVPPLAPLQLIRTISGLYADPGAAFVGRTIAFVGAKGGVGASTLAHNFAWCLAERIEVQACVVDYDLAFGTAGLDFNQDPVQSLHDALDKPERLDETLIERMLARCTERLSLLAAPATLDDDYDIPAEAYEEVAAKIRSTAPFMVLDLPHVWSGWMRRTLVGADEVVLVAQPDLASLRNAKNLLELVSRARPNDAPPRLVLNQVGLPGRPEIPLKDFGKALGVEPELVIPFDAKLFGQAANNGQMIGEVNPKARPSEALVQFAQALTRRAPAPPKPRSLVERLLKGG